MWFVPPTMALIGGLLACGSAPSPSGTLLVATDDPAPGHGHDHGTATVWVDAATGAVTPLAHGLDGRVFPAAADPQGRHALVIGSHDEGASHVETLALVPLGGGEATVLAQAEAVRHPAWSPDGEWIAFESSAASFRDLYRVRRDGTGLQRLTDAPHGSFEPSYSPDGARIVFASSRDGNAEIYVMNADGSAPRRLTDYPRDDMAPQFGRDGKQVIFLRQIGMSKALHVVSAEGGKPTVLRMLEQPVVTHGFALDPTGRYVAAAEQTSARELQVLVIDLATREVVASLGGEGVDEMPAWSPDGQWVVWSGQASGDTELWRARPDGSHQALLMERPGADWLPRWVK